MGTSTHKRSKNHGSGGTKVYTNSNARRSLSTTVTTGRNTVTYRNDGSVKRTTNLGGGKSVTETTRPIKHCTKETVFADIIKSATNRPKPAQFNISSGGDIIGSFWTLIKFVLWVALAITVFSGFILWTEGDLMNEIRITFNGLL